MWRSLIWVTAVLSLEGVVGAQGLPEQSFVVRAEVVAGCLVNQQMPAMHQTVGMLGSLDFGVLPGLSRGQVQAVLVQSLDIFLQCTPGTPLQMRIDGGQNVNSGQRRVRLADTQRYIAYQLYADAGLQQAIGVNVPTAISVVSARPIELPIYGQMVVPSGVYPGSYLDTLTVVLEW